MSLLARIPPEPPTQFRWVKKLPPPGPNSLKITATWFCFREWPGRPAQPDVVEYGRTYRFSNYCGAPKGAKCPCQKVDHDPGDEDRT